MTIAAQGIKVAVQLLAIVILARLLAPSDFGTFAMVAAILAMFEIVKDMGLSAATVQRPTITDRQVSTLFWLNLGLGCGSALVLAALAPVLVWIFSEPILLQITPAVAFAFVLTGVATQHLALLRRQMHFTSVAMVQTGAEVVALVAAVTAAWLGLGLWALVIQRLTWAAAIAIGAWSACGWRPGRPGPFAEVRGLIAFGGNAAGAMTVGHLAANLDKVMIGWLWGASVLGLFERAQKLLLMPIQNLNTPLAMVALPALSRLASQPARYREAYVSAVTQLTMLVAPAGGLLIAAGDLVATVVLGPQWSEAGPILSWMGVSAVYMAASYTLSWLYTSQDRTAEMLRAGLVNTGLIVLSLAAGLPLGAVGVAAAYAIGGALVRLPILVWLVGRRGPVRAEDFAHIMALPVSAACAVTAAVFGLRAWPPVSELSDQGAAAIFLTATIVVALATYAAFPRGRRVLCGALRLPQLLLGREAKA